MRRRKSTIEKSSLLGLCLTAAIHIVVACFGLCHADEGGSLFVGTCVFVRLLGLQIKGLVIGSAVVAVPFAVPHVESAHMFLVEVTRVVNSFWLDLLYRPRQVALKVNGLLRVPVLSKAF